MNNEVQAITSKLESGTKSNLNLIDSLQNNYNLTKFVIDFSLPLNLNKMHKKNGYIEIFENYIIIVLWSGKVMYLKIDDLEKNFIEFKTVKTNINDHLRFDDEKFISIKDILILDNKLYVTYTKNLNPAKNCLNLSVLRANVLQEGEKLK